MFKCFTVAFLAVLQAAAGKCSGDHCASQDSGEMLLATKARLSVDHGKAVEDGAQQLDLPKLLDFTQKTGLPNLLELQNTLDKMVSDTVNETGNATASGNYTPTAAADPSITGLERTYDPTPKEEKALNAINAMQEIKGFLANVLAATRKLHADYQKLLNNAAEQVLVVNTDMKASFDRIEQLHDEREAARVKHSSCRSQEAKITSTFAEQCDGSDGIDTIRLKKAPNAEALPREALQKILDTWETASSDGDKAVLYEKIGVVSKYFDPDGKVAGSAAGCLPSVTSSSPLPTTNAACDSNQTVFEYADCGWHGENDQVCGLYNERFEYEKKNYYHSEEITIRSEETRKAEHEAVKRIECYLAILNATQVNKKEMLTTCRNAVYSADHLNIVYPRLDAKKYSCTVRGVAPADQTCGANWIKREYTDQAWYSDVKMEACQTCPTPAPTPAPTVEKQAEPVELEKSSITLVAEGNWYGKPNRKNSNGQGYQFSSENMLKDWTNNGCDKGQVTAWVTGDNVNGKYHWFAWDLGASRYISEISLVPRICSNGGDNDGSCCEWHASPAYELWFSDQFSGSDGQDWDAVKTGLTKVVSNSIGETETGDVQRHQIGHKARYFVFRATPSKTRNSGVDKIVITTGGASTGGASEALVEQPCADAPAVKDCPSIAGWDSAISLVRKDILSMCVTKYVNTGGKGCSEWCKAEGYVCLRGQDNGGDCELSGAHASSLYDGHNGCDVGFTDQMCQCGKLQA